MNKRAMRSGLMLCFSRWNRKGYAIFASLGRNVRIGRLAIHICEMSLQKSSRKGVIVMLAAAAIGAAIPLPRALNPQKTEEVPDGDENAPSSATPDGEGVRHA